jgi:hypothetical protein
VPSYQPKRTVTVRRYRRAHHPAGITLVEVLGALALLGTILVWMIASQSRIVKQAGRAQRRLDAIRLADHLLTGWWQDRTKFPVQGSGPVGDEMIWLTKKIQKPELERLGAQVVRLEIIDQRSQAAGVVLSTVEVVLPDLKQSPDRTDGQAEVSGDSKR